MRRIITLVVGLTWVGMGPPPATAQTVQEQINAMQATIAAQAQQIAALVQNGQIQSALTEDAASPFKTSAGTNALANNAPDGLYNSAFGYKALEDNTEGDYNTATGAQALQNNTTGDRNTASGR